MEKKYRCEECPLRAKYDQNPHSPMGRFWRWHINFCPGWKGYFLAQSDEAQQQLRERYHFNKYKK